MQDHGQTPVQYEGDEISFEDDDDENFESGLEEEEDRESEIDRGCYRDKKQVVKESADEDSIFEPDPESVQQMKFSKATCDKTAKKGPIIRYETDSERILNTPEKQEKFGAMVRPKQHSNSSSRQQKLLK